MRILYIITQADGGGAQKYTLALAKHFGGDIAAGNESTGLFEAAEKLQVTSNKLQNLKRSINPLSDLLATWEIRELVKKLNPDIIHLNSSKAGILGSFACIGLKKKVVFTAHGFVFNEVLPYPVKMLYVALEKIASEYRDYIITVSDADRQSALAYKLIDPEKISTIHNGIPEMAFYEKTQAVKTLGLPGDKIIIGTVANFYKTKGLDVLIEAVSMLSDDIKSKIIVSLIGEGPEREKLSAVSCQLSAPIVFLGKVDNASAYLKAFNIFILPSRKEGLPYTLLEAMQAGLPIITTNVGGNPEAVGNAGILVEPENPTVLAAAITGLLADQKKQKDLSTKALERSKLFTETKMFGQTEEVYKKLLS